MRANAADQWTRPVSLSTFNEGKPDTVTVTVSGFPSLKVESDTGLVH